MDTFLHFCLNYGLSGNLWVGLGGIIPDIIYILVLIFKIPFSLFIDDGVQLDGSSSSLSIIKIIKLRYSKAKESSKGYWSIGERSHSIFIIPSLFILLMFLNEIFFYLLIGFLIHILLDMISHKKYGPRFFWPIRDEFISVGIFQWEDHPRLSIIIIFFSLIMCVLQLKLFL